jgi:polyferredoxin
VTMATASCDQIPYPASEALSMATQVPLIEHPKLARTGLQGAATSQPAPKPRKKLIRRTGVDRSQLYRRSFQGAFLLLNVWLGANFYFWVRQFEVGLMDTNLHRPPGVEGWLPIAGLMNLKYWLLSGQIPQVHPAALFLLVTFLAISFLFRKAFCSWLCPIGTISEYLWLAGKKMFKCNFRLPRWLDLPLRGLKYFLLGFFVWAISTMSVVGIRDFMHSPYGLIADVKMLNFFRHIGQTGLIVLGVFVVASIFIQNFWCRFLCPYGALLGFTSWLSPTRIRRNTETCIDCAKCAKACPASLPVDELVQIRSVECTGCMECVAVCPAQDALAMSLPNLLPVKTRPTRVPAWAMAAGIAVLFFGVAGFARATGHWNSAIPTSVYERLVPNADQAAHPMPER